METFDKAGALEDLEKLHEQILEARADRRRVEAAEARTTAAAH